MELGSKTINNLPSHNQDTNGYGLRNPYKEVLEALDLWEARNPKAGKVTVAELRELGVSPIARMTIKGWILSFEVPDEELLELQEEEVKERVNEVPVSVEALRKKAEEEALKWDLEHSNNLYHRYKLLKEKKAEFELLRSKVKWADFGEKRKILVLAHYIMEALKQDTNMVTLANLRKPSQFYYLDAKGRKIRFNELAFNGFVKELGLDPEEPITGEDLAVILVRRFGYTEESLKGFYEEIVRDLIKPSRMRLPPCIEALAFRPLFYDTKKGRIIDEGLKVLASWFKYYARGYTTGRIQGGKDKKVLLFEFLLSKLYGDVIDVTEQAEILQRFKKFYEEAKPFKCAMVQEFESSVKFGEGLTAGGVKICSNKCPFVAPLNRTEEVLATVQEVNLYGADHLEMKVEGVSPFFEDYSPNLTPRSKLVQKFAGFLGTLYRDPLIKPEEALEILEALLERARIVKNYVSPLVAVETGFKEVMEELLENGVLPWELRSRDKPFLDKTGKLVLVTSSLIGKALPAIESLEGYTTRKLIRDLKKLPNSPIKGIRQGLDVKKDSYSKEKTTADFWLIGVKWLEEHGIDVRVKVPTLEEPKTEEQKEPEEDLKDVGVNLTPLEKLILGATREPKGITELIDLGEKARKSEEEVTTAVARLMHLGLVKMGDGGKLQRTVGVGPNE